MRLLVGGFLPVVGGISVSDCLNVAKWILSFKKLQEEARFSYCRAPRSPSATLQEAE